MMTEQPDEELPTIFHVEEQEVIYWTRAIDASDKDAARVLVIEEGHGEVVGRRMVSRLVTNIHPLTDACDKLGCTVPS